MDILKSDIFFVVTTVAVTVLSVAAVVAILYIILILRNVKNLSDTVRREGEALVGDAHAVREGVKSYGKAVVKIVEKIVPDSVGFKTGKESKKTSSGKKKSSTT